jgi:hypothetical protein
LNPTREQITAIQGYVAGLPEGWALFNQAITGRANEPTIPVESPREMVPTRYDLDDVLDALSFNGLTALRDYGQSFDVLRAIAANDTLAVLAVFDLIDRTHALDEEDFQAVKRVVTREESDPRAPSLISWAQSVLHRDLDTADVNTARHSPGGQS